MELFVLAEIIGRAYSVTANARKAQEEPMPDFQFSALEPPDKTRLD